MYARHEARGPPRQLGAIRQALNIISIMQRCTPPCFQSDKQLIFASCSLATLSVQMLTELYLLLGYGLV